MCTRYFSVNSGVDQTFWFCSDMVHVIFFPLDDLVDWVGYDGVPALFLKGEALGSCWILQKTSNCGSRFLARKHEHISTMT